MFGFRQRRRRRILAEPFPAAWQAIVHREVGLYALLDAGERAAVRDALRIFIAEKNWEGTRDFDVVDRMKVIVAANASILTLGLDGDPLRHARTIIIQPDEYAPPAPRIERGIATTGTRATGTAYVNGPVVLSWRHILRDSHDPGNGRNVVLHEFAHQLDMTGGVVDGTPPLRDRGMRDTWRRVMTREFDALVDAAEHGVPTLIDHYGATNPAEFFAVTTECFFERGAAMRERHPALYDLLRAYYRQDPARRATAHGAGW